MSKTPTKEELHTWGLTLARNRHFSKRLDEFEKGELKRHLDFEVWYYDTEIRIGLKNISTERTENITRYKLALKRLRMEEMDRRLEEIMNDNVANNNEVIDSNAVLGKLMAIDAPQAKGYPEAKEWLIKVAGLSPEKATKKHQAVFNCMNNHRGSGKPYLTTSLNHLDKMLKFIDVNPQLERIREAVNHYRTKALDNAKSATK